MKSASSILAFLNWACESFCGSWGSEHLLMVIKSIWLKLIHIHVTKWSHTLRRHTNGKSSAFFFITGLLFRKSQCTLNICHYIWNVFPVYDPTILVSSENNYLFPLNGRTLAPWGGCSLSLSRSGSVKWVVLSDGQLCLCVMFRAALEWTLVHTRVCLLPCLSTHLREVHRWLCSASITHYNGQPVLKQKCRLIIRTGLNGLSIYWEFRNPCY